MKVLFCGSRTWCDAPRTVEGVRHLRGIVHREVASWVENYGENLTVIEGECRGPDKWAAEGAILAGLSNEQIIRMPAEWVKDGVLNRYAGFERNSAMLDLNPDYVVAFYNGLNGGTHDTVTKALGHGIPVFVVSEGGESRKIDPST